MFARSFVPVQNCGQVGGCVSIEEVSVRILVAALLVLSSALPLRRQESHSQAAPSAGCVQEGQALGWRYDEIVSLIWPPDWDQQAVTIAMGEPSKLILRTDGDKEFELLAGEPEQPDVYGFLLDLANSCRLPADPEAAADLVKMRWETRQISRAQFEKLHADFTAALAQYAARINATYGSIISTHLISAAVDAGRELIVYDNFSEHVEVYSWIVEGNKDDPILKWGRELNQSAADTFHRPYRGY